MMPEKIDPLLCTHILFGFGRISNDGILKKKVVDPEYQLEGNEKIKKGQEKILLKYFDWLVKLLNEPMIQEENIAERTIALKNKNAQLKVLLSIGGNKHDIFSQFIKLYCN